MDEGVDERRKKTSSDDFITKITVHYCEKLKSGMSLKQPVVCMHVVDAESGSYIKKSQSDQAVVSYYESQRSDLDYIMPIMTQACRIQGERYLEWENSFILNENFDYIINEDMNTIIFFEVIDLMSQPYVSNRSYGNGMRKIAWSFLKINGQNGARNIGSKLPLRLYKAYPSQKSAKSSKIEVHNWYAKCHRIPLPGSLYVTIEACRIFVVNPALRSMLPLQQETSMSTSDQDVTTIVKNTISVSSAEQNCANDTIMKDQSFELPWSRKSNDTCKVPDELHTIIETTGTCLELKFSHSGRYLLAACGSQEHYYLLLTEIPSGKILQKEFAHCRVIYDIDWSYDDTCVLSASSDYSVKIWNVKPWSLAASLVHPSFVYAAKFKPAFSNIVATACFDHLIRIWKINKGKSKAFELEGHVGSVCALEWQKSGKVIYTADSLGHIRVWKVLNLQRKDDCSFFVMEKEIDLPSEVTSIKKLISEKDNLLCVFCKDSVKVLDVYSGYLTSCTSTDNMTQVVLWNGCRGCFSPCGTLLFICHEDGHISVWDKCTSQQIFVMRIAKSLGKLSSIDYHPSYHMLAVSAWKENMPIHLYIHNQNSSNISKEEMKEAKDPQFASSCSAAKPEKVDDINSAFKNTNSFSSCYEKSEKHICDENSETGENSVASSSKYLGHPVVTSEVLKKSLKLSHYSLRSRAENSSSAQASEFSAFMGSDDPPNEIGQSSSSASLPKSSKRSQRRKKLKDSKD